MTTTMPRVSFLSQLTVQEYEDIVEKAQVPVNKGHLQLLAAATKVLDYAVKFFFIATAAGIFVNSWRKNNTHLALLVIAFLCFISSFKILSSVKDKLEQGQRLSVLATKINASGTERNTKNNLLGIAKYWEDRAEDIFKQIPKEGQGFTPEFLTTNSLTTNALWMKYFNLNRAFYEAVAGLDNSPVKNKRLDDLFLVTVPSPHEFQTAFITSALVGRRVDFLTFPAQINQLITDETARNGFIDKAQTIANAHFIPQTIDQNNPPPALKDQFVELLKLIPNKT